MHLNPRVQEPVLSILGSLANLHLVAPIPYAPFVRLLDRASLVISDSGGIQEEATALGKPVLVLRDVTERPEGVEDGIIRLVGTDPVRIATEASRLMAAIDQGEPVCEPSTAFGDGSAAETILDHLEARAARP